MKFYYKSRHRHGIRATQSFRTTWTQSGWTAYRWVHNRGWS